MLNWTDTIRLAIFDTAKGLTTRSYYNKFKKAFTLSPIEIKAIQSRKLQELIKFAYYHIPYYHNLFKRLAIKPSDIMDVSGLRMLPALSREDLINNYDQLQDSNNKYRKLFHSSSSGTTGTPVRYIHDIRGESAGIAAGYALFSLAGWAPGKKTLHIWGNPKSVKKWNSFQSKFKQRLLNQVNYPAYLLNDRGHYNSLLALIEREKPLFIDGYSSSIGSFAQWLDEQNYSISGVHAVFTTAENLTHMSRSLIEKRIGPVSDLYGCGEINGIAIQPPGINKYFVLDTHVIVETREKDGVNEILVTDLDNRVMPLIRYKIGDTIDKIAPPSSVEMLPFSSFKSVDGRLADYIALPNGKIIHPVNILGGTFLRKFPEIRKHKVIWNGKKLSFLLECSTFPDRATLVEEISANIGHYEVEFDVTFTEKLLPDKNGKFRYVEILIER